METTKLQTHQRAMAESPTETVDEQEEPKLDKLFHEVTTIVQTITDDGAVFIDGKRKTRSRLYVEVSTPRRVMKRPVEVDTWVPAKGFPYTKHQHPIIRYRQPRVIPAPLATTPTEFRESYVSWQKTAPSNDSDIFPPPPRQTDSQRHEQLAPELHGLSVWRGLSKVATPLSTNWSLAANDNNRRYGTSDEKNDEALARAPDRSAHCEYVIRPRENEIIASVASVEWEVSGKIPLDGPDVEYGEPRAFEWCSVHGTLTGYTWGPVWRLGKLKFCTEDSVGPEKNRSPTRGSVIAWRAGRDKRGKRPIERYGAPLGGAWKESQEDIDDSNQFFSDRLFNAQPHRYIKRGKVRIDPPEERELPLPPLPPISMSLADARAFCGLSPAVPPTDNRPALPCGSARARDSFIGHRVTREAFDVPLAGEADDWFTRPEAFAALRGKLASEDVTALDTALYASNLEDIGAVFGHTGKTAERQGKARLLKASKNLSALLSA